MILTLVAIIVILLNISVRVHVKICKSQVIADVRYCGFSLYKYDSTSEKEPENEKPESTQDDSSGIELTELEEVASTRDEENKPSTFAETANESAPQEKKEENKAENCEEDEKSSDNDNEQDEKEKKPITQRWQEIKQYIPIAKKAFRKLLKMIRIYDLDVSLTVGGADAHKAAMNFAHANQAFYPALSLLCCVFTVTIKHTQLSCDYDNPGFDYNGSFILAVRPSAVLGLAAYLGINYLKIKAKSKSVNTNGKKDEENE